MNRPAVWIAPGMVGEVVLAVCVGKFLAGKPPWKGWR